MKANIVIAPATREDSRAIWEIRYHPSVNAVSAHQEAVNFETHDAWSQKKYFSNGPNKCFVLKSGDRVLGYCRFDEGGGNFIVSIALHPDFHGQGLGHQLLSGALLLMGPGHRFRAEIKKDNVASRRLFEKNGFTIERTVGERVHLMKT